MLNNYIYKLMENLPEYITKSEHPIKIDLILGGGAFNGSYILGALHFFKELERKNYIIIERISTCSISSILGLLYLTDNLDKANELYFDLITDLKNKGNLSKLNEIQDLLGKIISDDICDTINNKLYICYNNVNKCKKYVVNKYKDKDFLFDIIKRSCYIPLLIDFQLTYKNKYIDGIIPYFYKHKNGNKQIYLDVYTLDKIFNSLNVKNEKNNYHRLFEGILDVHKFFIKNCNTTMCSDLDNWNIKNYIRYYIYIIIEQIIVYFIKIIYKINKYIRSCKVLINKINIEKLFNRYLLLICF
jgi:hypothetical protein